MGRYKNIDNKKIADAYFDTACSMSATAQKLNITRTTLYNWRADDPELDEMLKEKEESLGDFVDTQLIRLCQQGFFPALKFLATTRFADRYFKNNNFSDTEIIIKAPNAPIGIETRPEVKNIEFEEIKNEQILQK